MMLIRNKISVTVDAEITINGDPIPIETACWTNSRRMLMELMCNMNGMELGDSVVNISIASKDLNTQDLDFYGGHFTYDGKQIDIKDKYYFGVMPEIMAKQAKEKFTIIRFPLMQNIDPKIDLVELSIVTNAETLKAPLIKE